eukprot:11984695-Karenia_brevis.AAC.1
MAANFKADAIQLQNRLLTLVAPLNQESPRARVEDEGDARRRREDRQETRGRGRGDVRRRGDDSPAGAAAVERCRHHLGDVRRGSDRGRRDPSPAGDSRVSNQGSDNQGVWADVEPRQRKGARSGEPRPAGGEPRQSSGGSGRGGVGAPRLGWPSRRPL